LKDGFFFITLLFFFGFAKTFSCGTGIYAFIAYPAKGGEVNSLKKGWQGSSTQGKQSLAAISHSDPDTNQESLIGTPFRITLNPFNPS
jgi:hypothetical protein